jgi:hypothetical protein
VTPESNRRLDGLVARPEMEHRKGITLRGKSLIFRGCAGPLSTRKRHGADTLRRIRVNRFRHRVFQSHGAGFGGPCSARKEIEKQAGKP